MSANHIQTLLDKALKEHLFSAYQLWAERDDKVLCLSGGKTSYFDGAVAVVSSETLFDIGSLTKAVLTTTLLGIAYDKKLLALQDTLSKHLPAVHGKLADLTIFDLLTHSSGLKAWHPIYEQCDQHEILEWISKNQDTLLAYPARSKSVYSDINFMLLGFVAENFFGELGYAFQQHIAIPLGITSVKYGPIQSANVAATEYCTTTQKPLRGIVFDENARFLKKHLGHAGLFGNTEGLAKICRLWLMSRTKSMALKDPSPKNPFMFSQPTAMLFTTRARVPDSTWALGWDTKSESGSSCGAYFSKESFGHLGYPGCSIWIDPQKNAFIVFLSNRIHPSRYDERIRGFRPELHDAVAGQW